MPQILQIPDKPVGAELARDDARTACICIDSEDAIASRLAPTVERGMPQILQTPEKPVGAELARDDARTGSRKAIR